MEGGMGDRKSIALRQGLSQAIKDEILERTKAHQARMRRLAASQATLTAAGAPVAQRPLVLLAHGDSWFDYPLSGNDVTFGTTDVIAQLETMGKVTPIIHNISHHGDATTDELSLPKQERLIEALRTPENWPETHQPDAILFSGGGNDIAGDQFCIFLDYAVPGSTGLNAERFGDALRMVEASYRDLFAFRDRYAKGTPIFGHCYDFAIPNGTHPLCAGPWLRPSLDYCGWSEANKGRAIVRQALETFRTLVKGLADDPANNFILVETQGTLADTDWANELHPYPDGFKKIAAKFVQALEVRFPGRI
jgi:hypothetical protein